MKLFRSRKKSKHKDTKDALFDLLVDSLKSIQNRRIYVENGYDDKMEDYEKTLSMNRMEASMVLDYVKKVGHGDDSGS